MSRDEHQGARAAFGQACHRPLTRTRRGAEAFDHEPGDIDSQVGLRSAAGPVHAFGIGRPAAIGVGQHHHRRRSVVSPGPLVRELERLTRAQPVVRASGGAGNEHQYRQARMRHREVRRGNPNPTSPMDKLRLASRNIHVGDHALRRKRRRIDAVRLVCARGDQHRLSEHGRSAG